MKKIIRYLDDHFEESIMVALLAFICCATMLQIIMRYCFQHALPWPEEFCRFAFVYTGFLSAGYCIKNGNVLRVDVLIQFLPKVVQNGIVILGKLLTLIVYLYLGWSSLGLIASTTSVSTAMQISYKFVYAALPLGFFLGAVRQVQDFVRMYKNRGKEAD